MADIQIKATDGAGSFKAYVIKPKAEPATASPVVVVIQEIFGINDAIRATCQEMADMGFIAVAPDLFWRLEPNVDLTDKSEAEWKKAFDLMNRFDQDKGIDDLKATVAEARKMPGSNGHVGTIGFCLGGRLAFMMATRSDADVNISYYGVGLEKLLPELDKVKHPLLVHVAAKDEFSSDEARAQIIDGTRGHAHVTTHLYPDVQHAFARVNGVHYDARAATIANGRSAELLVKALG